MTETAAATYRWIAEMTSASGTDWALGVEARSRALVTEGNAAESLYQDSIMHLGRSRVRAELARAHLLYGEWLRRRRRRTDAREQLRTAHDMLEAMGMEAFAERARRELRATGETARKRTAAATDEELTAQETQIARLAREDCPTPRSVPGCSSARAPSSTTWATSSPSSASPRAASSSTPCLNGPGHPARLLAE